MNIKKNHRLQLLIQNNLFVLFLIIVVLSLGILSYRYHTINDVTQNQRNTLTQQSIQALAHIDGPIDVTAFVTNSPDKGKFFRKTISTLIARYQLIKPNLTLTFIDPTKEPKLAQASAIQAEGEMIIVYEKRSEHMTLPYTEEAFTNLLIRLSRSSQQSLNYLTGHRERDFLSANKSEFGKFGHAMASKGLQINAYDLNIDNKIQPDYPLLIVAAPKTNLTPEESNRLKRHLEAGGNLLWLLDDNNLRGLNEVADYLNLEVNAGIAMDNSNEQYGISPTLVTANAYGNHDITKQLALRTFFPEAHRVSAIDSRELGWKVKNLVGVAANGWLETSPNEYRNTKNKAVFNEKTDLRGPINIGIALERTYGEKGQRVVVIGNSQFLSNENINSGGNLELGLNMVNWLASDNRFVDIQPKPLRDSVVIVPQDSVHHGLVLLIFNSFQFLIPFLLLVYGFITWRRHQRT